MIYNVCTIVEKEVYVAEHMGKIIYIGSPEEGFNHLLKDLKITVNDISEGDLSWFQEELTLYEKGQLKSFKTPVQIMSGTPFQRSVWKALMTIPYGCIKTYSDVAKMIDNPKAVRAVASAIGSNPIMIMIPCHRVNGKDGSLRGFRGGLDLKVAFQQIEGSYRA